MVAASEMVAKALPLHKDGRLLIKKTAKSSVTQVEKHRATEPASKLLAQLRARNDQSFAPDAQQDHLEFVSTLCEARLPDVPVALQEYAEVCITEGIVAGAAVAFTDKVLDVPQGLQLYMSGEKDRALQFRDSAVGGFLKALFEEISKHAAGDVRLIPTDLYHGHLFISSDTLEGEVEAVDMGILFHAKEFPKEWRKSRWADWHPVGDEKAGGARNDPRVGTLCSVKDPTYPLRNLLWLLSTNKLYQLDCSSELFSLQISRDEYCTLAVTVFDTCPLGDINYFPEHSAEVFCCPRFGFGETLQILQLTRSVEREADAEIERIIDRAEDDAAELLSRLAAVAQPQAGELPRGEQALRARIPPKVWHAVQEGLRKRHARRAEETERHNVAEVDRMLQAGVMRQDALLALEATAVAGRFSEMRASSLMQLTSVAHRDAKNRDRFGSQEYSLAQAATVLAEAVWVENAFVALHLIASEGLSLELAVQRAIEAAAQETERQIEEQLALHRKARQGEGAQSEPLT